MTTKEKILEKAMKLFSVHGYNSVTVKSIAAEVGIQNSGLYKHFSSKRAILDAIVANAKERFMAQSEVAGMLNLTLENLTETCLSMFKFQTEDEWTVNLRRILIMEQFHDEQLASLYKEFFIDMQVMCQAEIFKLLMKDGIMKKNDPIVLSMELFASFFLYHTIEFDYAELEPRFKKHISNFIHTNFEGEYNGINNE